MYVIEFLNPIFVFVCRLVLSLLSSRSSSHTSHHTIHGHNPDSVFCSVLERSHVCRYAVKSSYSCALIRF